MGRNKKVGLDYFPMDVDFFQDIRIRKLIKYQGGKAVTVYALLLCTIYKQGYYMRWDEGLPFIISEQTGFEEAYIQEVFKCCLMVGLFSKKLYDSNKILTSKGIQDRYQMIGDLCRRRVDISSEFMLISSEEIPITSEEIPFSSEEKPINSAKSTQSKRKENKKNNITPSPPLKGGGRRKKKEADGINSKARSIFENYFRETFSDSYYWAAKDAGAMSQLLNKLKFQREQKQMDVSDDSLLYALQYLLSSIKDGWIFENFSVTNINSKFNEIVSQTRKNHGTKPTYSNIYEQNRKDSEQRKLNSVLAVATTVREAAAKKRAELEAEGIIDKIP